jgi:two-component system, OmpR family, aerobic respiration control sensor histidine kinase ArcB
MLTGKFVAGGENKVLEARLPAAAIQPGKPRLLVVDDQSYIGYLLKQQLQEAYDVEVASSFDEALLKGVQQSFAAAILDLDLGCAKTGVDLLHALRRIPHHAALPALAYSLQTKVESRERILGDGFNEHLSKSFNKKELLAAVAGLLNTKYEPEDDGFEAEQQDKLFYAPPLPSTLPEIVQLLAGTERVPDTDRLVEILSRDSVAVSWVLRHVNSAYYSLVHKISSIERAVAMLGFDPVCNLVLTRVLTGAFSRLDSPKAVGIYRQIMKASAAAAAFSRSLAYYVNLPKPETAFTAGLLHQLGRLALLSSDSRLYTNLWEDSSSSSGKSQFVLDPEQERRAYGTDYTRLGAQIGREWQLPEDLLTVIRHHTNPNGVLNKAYLPLTLTVAAGCEAARRLYRLEEVQALAKQQASNSVEEFARYMHVLPEKVNALIQELGPDVQSFANSIVVD